MGLPTSYYRSRRPITKNIRIHLRVEQLEARAVPAGYSPSQMLHAYGFDKLPYDGAGQTIAIVDAYDNPNIGASLTAFNQRYGLPAAIFEKAMPQGKPVADPDWGFEIALDVEWAHAIAPAAKILLVEAKSASYSDLLGAVSYAVGRGASVVSMSWGSSEFAAETGANYDGKFASLLAANPNVTFVASSGDSGTTSWPAVSPYVIGVGGTSLQLDSAGNMISEVSWGNGKRSVRSGGSGGGTSLYENKPSYQNALVSGTKRKSPDVAYDADPNTGVNVYDISSGGWWEVGGTSAGAPQWAGLIALANQARASVGKSPLSSYSQTLPALYGLDASYFHDITSGSNVNGSATAGYDVVTGRGSPRADLIVAALAGVSTSATTSTTTTTTTTTKTIFGTGHKHALISTAEIIVAISVRAPDQNVIGTSPTQTLQPQQNQTTFQTIGLPTLRTVIVAPSVYLSLLPDNSSVGDSAEAADENSSSTSPSTEVAQAAVSAVFLEGAPTLVYHAPADFSRTWEAPSATEGRPSSSMKRQYRAIAL